jgi:hypothetical protein
MRRNGFLLDHPVRTTDKEQVNTDLLSFIKQ